MEEQGETLTRIHQAAMEEFLEKGFADASLRQIVKNAGVTTGAFYGYYSSKDALFTALVEPHAAAVMGIFRTAGGGTAQPCGGRIQRMRQGNAGVCIPAS